VNRARSAGVTHKSMTGHAVPGTSNNGLIGIGVIDALANARS
jgi:hypothetical protein